MNIAAHKQAVLGPAITSRNTSCQSRPGLIVSVTAGVYEFIFLIWAVDEHSVPKPAIIGPAQQTDTNRR